MLLSNKNVLKSQRLSDNSIRREITLKQLYDLSEQQYTQLYLYVVRK